MKIRYILVDDNPRTVEKVNAEIQHIVKDYDLVHVGSYTSSKKAYEEIDASSFDVLIVDFQMPVYNGIQLAKKIALHKKIIFLTSTVDKHAEIINNLDIAGYLSKPFEIEEFEKILQKKVIGKIKTSNPQKNNSYIAIPISSNKNIGIYPDQIFYISTARNRNGEQPKKNCVHMYGKEDEIIHKDVRYSINDFSKLLSEYDFKKINKSTIINVSCVKEQDNKNIQLYDTKETFEITEKEKTSFISKFASFFSSKK